MTIEIQELIIQARVTESSTQAIARASSWEVQGRMERERLVEQIARRVLESLRDDRGQR